jgi:hypothetical protein
MLAELLAPIANPQLAATFRRALLDIFLAATQVWGGQGGGQGGWPSGGWPNGGGGPVRGRGSGGYRTLPGTCMLHWLAEDGQLIAP